ncbi:hypothetical protein FRC10_009147 [Ceratobasidium sp. 414]|nr:hypothetical protein FRC10_009147 [Ceratobasidium sp. 414]
MKETWESSDDEMDLLARPLPERVDNDRENNEEEVLTSDAEELAEPAVATRPRATDTPQPSSPSSSLSLPHHSQHSPVSPARESTSNIPQGRTLRARTARQQHPYALEYAHYKNSMRRAGLDDAIVKLQAMEREKAEHGHQKPVGPEMEGFIVPGDEESEYLYVPPATPSRVRGSGTIRTITPSPQTQKRVRPRVFPPRHPTQISDDSGNDIVDTLSSDDHSSIVEITIPVVDDEEISSWLARKSPKRTRGGGKGGGGDLINRRADPPVTQGKDLRKREPDTTKMGAS